MFNRRGAMQPDALSTAPAASRLSLLRERYREAGLSVILALQATIIFVVSPLAGTGHFSGEVVEALRFSLAAVAILIVNRSPWVGLIVGATFVVSLACTMLLRNGAAGQAIYVANILVTIAFDLAVAWTVAHAAFDNGRISIHRIMGAVILYLYIGLIFAGLYRLAAMYLHPGFNGLSDQRRGALSGLLYFSLTTLTTSGYGDITPVHPFLRSMANLEAVIGQLYPATFLARLVTLHGADADPRSGRRERDEKS
jgi:hypothetical protein